MTDPDLYAKVCAAYKAYPDGAHREKIKEQKETFERKYPRLKVSKNGEKVE
jgi:hypothetical protein